MADIGTDFLMFLKANYPEDYGKLATNDVADILVTAIASKHQTKFDIWKKVPERIRDEYHGRVPDDILEKAKRDSNLTLEECREIENNRSLPNPADFIANYDAKALPFTAEDTQSCKQLAKSFIADKGYDKNTAYIFAVGTILSKKLDNIRTSKDTPQFVRNIANNMKHKMMELGVKLGRKSQKKHRPELALLVIARDLNAHKTDKDTALPQMDVLMRKIKESGRETELMGAIKSPRYKALKHDTRILFESLMQSYDMGNVAHNLEKVRHKNSKRSDRNAIISNKTKPTENIVKNTIHEKHEGKVANPNTNTDEGR